MTGLLVAFTAGLVIATLTTPVGISGAVFLLPVQLQFLSVSSPQVTPTNLLFNIVSAPGALWKFHRRRAFSDSAALTVRLLAGTVPGVLLGAAVRVFLAPGEDVARLLAVALLAPIGYGLVRPRRAGDAAGPGRVSRWVTAHQRTAAFVVGAFGGVYGIGGGSILSPLLVAGGLTVGLVAPAALATTWITSVVGAAAFTALAPLSAGTVSPAWGIGLACGLGGLIGGYLGVMLQPRIPERGLRAGLGAAALAVSALYAAQLLT
ncbi:TSUP family transporter [Dietzia sp. UBA5065]|uniref:TSUP family transporter n=1 Tax=Dietzia sp. UBA5065 TaxID=1946422 RepID=UPI0025BD4206|nr:TSUP family transporter [Dietzia sp. UBA5065]HMT49648.1 TSUP family transporter [Dietzia sp.]